MIKRGQIWTGIGTGYASKPRPVLIIQHQDYSISDSEVVALITSDTEEDLGILRYKLVATPENGLDHDSYVCLDKLGAIPVSSLDKLIGEISHTDLIQIDKRLIKILGFDELFEISHREKK